MPSSNTWQICVIDKGLSNQAKREAKKVGIAPTSKESRKLAAL